MIVTVTKFEPLSDGEKLIPEQSDDTDMLGLFIEYTAVSGNSLSMQLECSSSATAASGDSVAESDGAAPHAMSLDVFSVPSFAELLLTTRTSSLATVSTTLLPFDVGVLLRKYGT